MDKICFSIIRRSIVIASAFAIFAFVSHKTATFSHSQETTQRTDSPGAVFTVTNIADSGVGSFRQAIIDANASSGTDEIRFQIGTGPVSIFSVSALPDITQPVIIDGTTQPGYSGTPLIRLSGNFAGGLKITGGESTVKAIAVTNDITGITLENGGGNMITGCFIGIDPENPTTGGNSANGVLINNSPNNRIGGTTSAERNIIGNNTADGVRITGISSSGNFVTGNYIGIRAPGALARNNQSAVAIVNAPNNRVGGTTPAERNILVGSAQGSDLPANQTKSGVLISGTTASDNVVEGNYIGTDIDGTTVITGSMRFNGVRIDNAPNNRVGGTTGTTPGGACTGACNVISGVQLRGGVYITGSGATGNTVQGNFIGTNAAGTALFGIGNNVGVTITAGASNNTIGGTTAAARNLITSGMVLTAGATGNTVQGNYIGTDTTGNVGIGQGTLFPNILVAVGIDSSPDNTIGTANGTTLGGACTGGCNLISGSNIAHGVFITGNGSTGNRLDYNYIGLNAAGTTALRNGSGAITLRNGANNNIIGRALSATLFQSNEACANNTPEVVRCVQDDFTGDWMQFDDVTGQYTWRHCRSGTTMSGVGEITSRPGFIRVFGDQVSATLNLSNNRGAGSGRFRTADGSVKGFVIQDGNVTDSTCACPTEGIQTIIGGVSSGVNNDPNPPNNNKFNFVSLGSSANGLVTLSNPTADGYIRHLAGNFNKYSNIFINTNGANFPPISISSGTDNFITGLNWTGIAPGNVENYVIDLNDNQLRDPNDPLDPDGGANRTQNFPVDLVTWREGIFDRVVAASFNSTPMKRFLIKIWAERNYYRGDFTPVKETYDTGLSFEVSTNENGDAYGSIVTDHQSFKGQKLTATATLINQVPITSGNFKRSFVDVLGDTSEFSIPAPVPQPKFDFDNDGKSDFSVVRPGATPTAVSLWYILNSNDFTIRIVQFGVGEDKPVSGDYQGDGATDFAVFRPSTGTWYNSRINGNPATNFNAVQWGLPTDIPVPGDYDNDAVNDAAVFRPSDRVWYIRRSVDGSSMAQQWGLATDKPVPADYDGNGDTDIAVYRDGIWYISICPTCPLQVEYFGIPADVPVPADYDGDGRDDIAVWRPSTGIWYIKRSTVGFLAVQFGLAGDKALNGDFDADGKSDVAVWRPSEGNWYVLGSTTGFFAARWGQNGDIPVPQFPNQ